MSDTLSNTLSDTLSKNALALELLKDPVAALDLSVANCGYFFWPRGTWKTLSYPKATYAVAEVYFDAIFNDGGGLFSPQAVVLEGYSYLSIYSAQRIAEVVGIMKYLCETSHIPIVVIAPSAGKKALTGKGRATKEEMIHAARALGYPVQTEHEADAVGLMVTYARQRKDRDPEEANPRA